MNKKKIIGSIAIVIAIFAIAAKISDRRTVMVAEKSAQPQAVSVQLASNSKTLNQEVEYPATIVGDQEVSVTAKSAGTVLVVPYGIGDKIGAGALLARIDDTGNALQTSEKGFQSAQVQQSQLSKEQAEESLALAKKNYKNLKEAYDEQQKDSTLTVTVSKAQVDSAKKQIDIAKLQLDSAKVGLKSVVDNHLITSPISGVILSKDVSVGDSVSVGQLIARVSKSSNVKVRFYVDQNQRSELTLGQEISMLDANSKSFPLKIENIAAAADPTTKRFLVEAVPSDHSGASLLSGTILTVKIKTSLQPQNRDDLILPLAAINVGQNESYIFIVDGNIARKTPITVVQVNGEVAEITAEIPAGTEIITDGAKLVHDGEAIVITR